jgi:ribosomal protein S15P/S13E
MDKKLIQEYGQDILCYRFRTARQKKRMQYKDFHKQLIRLHKEDNALYEQKRNLGWEPLLPPVQKGWKRSFVLRDDVARSKQAEFFEKILAKINTHDWSYRKDFKVKKRRLGRKNYVVKEQKLLTPYDWYFMKLGFSDAEKQFFHEVLYWDNRGRIKAIRYVFNEPWRFVLKVKPNIITKVRIKDAVLESKIARLRNYVKRNDLERQQSRVLHGNYKWPYWMRNQKRKEVNPLLNKPIYKIVDELKEQF